VIPQAEIDQAAKRPRDRVERARATALGCAAAEDVLRGDVEKHRALAPQPLPQAVDEGVLDAEAFREVQLL
jgi:hypothetical protein